MTNLVAPLIPKAGKTMSASPGDSLQFGAHTSIRSASKHRKMVSSVLHLKKESVGSRTKPTAFGKGSKAFKPPQLKVK